MTVPQVFCHHTSTATAASDVDSACKAASFNLRQEASVERDRKLAIWGAGMIGRGFVAELFQRAGYELILVDTDPGLVSQLRAEGGYRIINTRGDAPGEIEKVTRYRSFLSSDPVLIEEFSAISLLAVCVSMPAFEATARTIAAGLQFRAAAAPEYPLDVLLCGTVRQGAAIFEKFLDRFLSDRTRTYVRDNVGFVDTLVIRMGIEPGPDLMKSEPLAIVTNGFPFMPADKLAFKGPDPDVTGLLLTDRIAAEETRKFYTYNMVNALLGYMGHRNGYWFANQALEDPDIGHVTAGALEEVSRALSREFGFTTREMDEWNEQVLFDVGNPFLRDTTARLASDPINQLSRNDTLTGAALLCRRNGVPPLNLATGMAYAFLFAAPDDGQATEIQAFIAQGDIEAAVRHYCGLEQEPEIVDMVASVYQEALQMQERK